MARLASIVLSCGLASFAITANASDEASMPVVNSTAVAAKGDRIARRGPVDATGKPREPDFSWSVHEEMGRVDVFVVVDGETGGYRDIGWAGTLSLICIDNDHLEYRVSGNIQSLVVGDPLPNGGPQPALVPVGAGGKITFDQSKWLSGYFLNLLAYAKRFGDTSDSRDVVLHVNGQPGHYVSLEGFRAVRKQMLGSCIPGSGATISSNPDFATLQELAELRNGTSCGEVRGGLYRCIGANSTGKILMMAGRAPGVFDVKVELDYRASLQSMAYFLHHLREIAGRFGLAGRDYFACTNVTDSYRSLTIDLPSYRAFCESSPDNGAIRNVIIFEPKS